MKEVKVSKSFINEIMTIKQEIDYKNELVNRMVIGAITSVDDEFDKNKHVVNLDPENFKLSYREKEPTQDSAIEAQLPKEKPEPKHFDAYEEVKTNSTY